MRSPYSLAPLQDCLLSVKVTVLMIVQWPNFAPVLPDLIDVCCLMWMWMTGKGNSVYRTYFATSKDHFHRVNMSWARMMAAVAASASMYAKTR